MRTQTTPSGITPPRMLRARRVGATMAELITVSVIISVLLAGSVISANAVFSRSNVSLIDGRFDRVVQAQTSQASVRGAYMWGDDADDLQLQAEMPESLVRDLDLTHGTSTDANTISVAVGAQGTLALAARTRDGTCRWRTVSAPGSADPTRQGTADGVRCRADNLLPAGEPAAWE